MPDVPRRHAAVNLEFLRKDAKQLVRLCRAEDAPALQRVRAALPRLSSLDDSALAAAIKLADAQHAIAREHGHANWAVLKRSDNPLERLLAAVRGGALAEIRHHLPVFAPLTAASAHAAAALGDRRALEAQLDRDAALVSAPQADWPPLAYVAGSQIHRVSARHAAGLIDCARLLLDRGADPNAMTGSGDDPEKQVPIAVRAILATNMPIALLLLRTGVDASTMMKRIRIHLEKVPWAGAFQEYFQQPSVREHMERERSRFEAVSNGYIGGRFTPSEMRDLRASGKMPGFQVGGTGLWASLLDRGYDMNARVSSSGETVLHGLVRTAAPELVEMALSRGANANARSADGQSVMAAAVREGNRQTIEILRQHGVADADVTPVDYFIGACNRLDGASARQLLDRNRGLLDRLGHDDYEVLVRAVSIDRRPLVELMLDLGVDPAGAGEAGITPLHVAAWRGNVALVPVLLAHGALLDARDMTYHEQPIEWARHGSTHCRSADEDYRAVEGLIAQASGRG
jgi:ankyrin repeat protein